MPNTEESDKYLAHIEAEMCQKMNPDEVIPFATYADKEHPHVNPQVLDDAGEYILYPKQAQRTFGSFEAADRGPVQEGWNDAPLKRTRPPTEDEIAEAVERHNANQIELSERLQRQHVARQEAAQAQAQHNAAILISEWRLRMFLTGALAGGTFALAAAVVAQLFLK